MFASIRNNATLIILLVSASYSYGQTTVWLSDNASFADLDLSTAALPGTTGSFDIWVKTQEFDRLDSVGLDLMSMGPAIELTSAEIVIGRGRLAFYGEPVVAPEGTTITNISAIRSVEFGTGLGPGVPVDDATLDAYRFARIHYRVAKIGTSELQLKVGPGLIVCGCPVPYFGVQLGINDPFSDNFLRGATDAIVDGRIQVVPEPSSALLLIIGGWLLRTTVALGT